VSNENFKPVDSILTVKASASTQHDVVDDLNLPEGKSIAELIDDQEKNDQKTSPDQSAQ
jgi:hypothetical protein